MTTGRSTAIAQAIECDDDPERCREGVVRLVKCKPLDKPE